MPKNPKDAPTLKAVQLQARRPAPPASLDPAMAALWRSVVAGFPAGHFRAPDAPILESYVRHSIRASVLDEQIDAMQPEWLKDAEGLKRFKTLLDCRRQETASALSCGRSLRILQQSRLDKRGAANAADQADYEAIPKPWDLEFPAAESQQADGEQ